MSICMLTLGKILFTPHPNHFTGHHIQYVSWKHKSDVETSANRSKRQSKVNIHGNQMSLVSSILLKPLSSHRPCFFTANFRFMAQDLWRILLSVVLWQIYLTKSTPQNTIGNVFVLASSMIDYVRKYQNFVREKTSQTSTLYSLFRTHLTHWRGVLLKF